MVETAETEMIMRPMNLPDLLHAQVALNLADPSSWACVSSNAHAVLNKDVEFEISWFLQWQPILLPHRPWQYAVLTWRRMQGASPRRVAQFMLRVLQAKQQQQLQPAVPAPHPESTAGRRKYVTSWLGCEGQFGRAFPDLHPLPSTLRKVRKLLNKQQAAADLEALLVLCPCAADLLCQYASRDATAPSTAVLRLRRDVSSSASEPLPLLQRLTQHVFHSGRVRSSPSQLYTMHPSSSGNWRRNINAHRLGCFAALSAGHVPQLLWSLPMAFTTLKPRSSRPLLLTLLLPYAVRYSTAECVRAVLLRHNADSRLDALGPQHLAMAAGRTDLWAAGVVRVIMQLLRLKQLKPSHMRPAYKAAAVTGHLPVLGLLLGHAASAPPKHLPVLLQAVAHSGNSAVAQLLLGDSTAALAQLQQGSRAAQPHLVQHVLDSVQQLRSGCADLGPRACVELLGSVLPSRDVVSGMLVLCSWEAEAEAVQLFVAERLWAHLPAGTQAQLQEVCLRSFEVLQADFSSQHGWHSHKTLEGRVATQLQFDRDAAGLLFLLQHKLLPAGKVPGTGMFIGTTRTARRLALRAGTGVHAHQALQLHRLLKAQEGLEPQAAAGVSVGAAEAESADAQSADAAADLETAMSVIRGRLSAACAACDTAAVAQLEQLYMLCYMLLTPPAMRPGVKYHPATTAAIAPTLPVSLAGGKVVTVAHLSNSLGLPWGLLGRLLGAAGYDCLGAQAVDAAAAGAGSSSDLGSSNGSSSSAAGAGGSSGAGSSKGGSSSAVGAGSSNGAGGSSGGCSSMVVDAMLAVEAPQAAMQQGVLCTASRISLRDRFALVSSSTTTADDIVKHVVAHGYDLLLDRAERGSTGDDEQRRLNLRMRTFQQPHYMEHLQAMFDSQVKTLTSHGHRQQDEQQQGPPPLWQQVLLQLVAQQAPVLRSSCSQPAPGQPYTPWAERGHAFQELYSSTDVLLHGLQAGSPAQQVQDFSSSRLLHSAQATQAQPAAASSSAPGSARDQQGLNPPPVAPWGPLILHEALIQRAPELLALSLKPEWQQVLWGAHARWESYMYTTARNEGLSPITCRRAGDTLTTGRSSSFSRSLLSRYSEQLKQQQRDLAELQQQREQLLGLASAISSSCGPMVAAAGPVPPFVASAVQMALTLLQHPAATPDTLSNWLRYTVGVSSTLADLARARAIVAAVAAAEVIPPGARAVLKEAVRQVLAVGDPDLWSVVLLWSHRLPVQLDESDDEPGVPFAPADDDDDDDV